jgi:acetylornithine deacetylase/succinyl-diaminopimelate desuccinylase-like protein
MALDPIAVLASLVACPSPNPRREAPSAAYPGEADLLRLLETILTGLGARVRIEEVLPGRGNLLATFPGLDTSRTLLLAAHADTVPQDGMTIPPFTPEIRNGRLYGRGACDTKGGMAAILAALSRWTESRRPFPVNVCFAATCNEEFGAHGAKALLRDHPGEFTAAVAAEPTGLEIVHVHKGALRFAIEAAGLPAHSSTPERGASAVLAMTAVIRRIEGDYRRELAGRTHPLLDAPRVSVGLIQGGTQVNIVPDRCLIEVDRRTIPGETAASVLAEFEALLAAARRETDPRVTFTCRPTEEYPPLHQPADSPIARLAAEACRTVLGKAVFAAAPYATDAGVFGSLGLPSLVLGPGSLAQAHTQDEYVEVAAVRQATDVFESLIGLSGRFLSAGAP